MPLPTSTNPTSFSESAALPRDEARKHEWEEPHPGRRLSYPNDKPTTWGVYAGDEACRGGMAAKGLWPEYADFNFSVPAIKERRFGRSRTRTVPQELVLTNAGHERPAIQTAPLPRYEANYSEIEQQASYLEPTSEEVTPIETPEITSETSGTDSDAESFISGPARKRQALQPLDTSFQELQFTDFSNHLEIPVEAGHDDTFTLTEPEAAAAAFSVMSPEGEDLYGWNAVLERKTSSPLSENIAPYQQRRASRSKRSLLQRVFSPGGSSSPDETSRSPTSYGGMDFEGQGR